MGHNMTDHLLNTLIKRYPNHYELGEVFKKFWFFKKERPNQTLDEIEKEFIKNFQSKL